MPTDPLKNPLLIIAMDAGDPELIETWLAEGRMPNLATLIARSKTARLKDDEAVSEFGNWLTFFSGVSRAKHGVYYFRQLQPGSYTLGRYLAQDTGVLPFWKHLRGKDKRVAIIDAPESNIVPNLPGLQLADWATHQSVEWKLTAKTEPASLLDQAYQIYGQRMQVIEYEVDAPVEDDLKARAILLQRLKNKGELCRHLLTAADHDLIVVGFFEAHVAAHRFWDYTPGGLRDGQGDGRLTHAIREAYQATDEQIGNLLDLLPDNTNVFVASLYGMKFGYPIDGLAENLCHQLGYQNSAPPASAFSSPVALARRILPAPLRTAISQRLSFRLQDKLLTQNLARSTDWSQTRAFSIPALYHTLIRINLKGRDPQGIVHPGDEYHELLRDIEADFRQLTDPASGQPVIDAVYKAEELYGPQRSDALPDLFIHWKPTRHFMPAVNHPNGPITQDRPHYYRSSGHSAKGIVAAAGPDVAAIGDLSRLTLTDWSQMFLSLMADH
jgi:predicted AlkP superfamily phosphohydrolase/phosphomutase